MANTSFIGQIDLLALAGATMQNVNGEMCIVIPKNCNPAIFIGQSQNGRQRAQLDIIIRETSNNQYGNTHFIKANVGKTNRERLGISKDDLPRYTPILGNLKPYDGFQKNQEAPVDDLPEDNSFGGF